MGDFFLLLIVCFFAAIIASAISGALFTGRFPDIQNFAGPIILAAFLASLAVGIMLVRQESKNIKKTYETAYEEGYSSGYERGHEDSYSDYRIEHEP